MAIRPRFSSLVVLPVRLFPVCGATFGGIAIAFPFLLMLLSFLVLINRRVLWFLLVVLVLLVVKFLGDDPQNLFEWSKSALLFTINMSVLFGVGLIYTSPKDSIITAEHVERLRNYLILFFALHGIYLVLEIFTFNILHNHALLNPLGGFSPYGPNPDTTELSPYNPIHQRLQRPNGLAWEPSVAALWQIVGLSMLMSTHHEVSHFLAKFVAILLGVLVANSFIGYAVLAPVLLHGLFFSLRVPRVILRVLYPFILILALAAMVWAFNQIGLSDRMSEINRFGSSGYIRWSAPIELIRERGVSLVGFEQLGMRSYRETSLFQARDSLYSGIANMYFEIVVYFGLVGLLTYLFLVGRLVVQNLRDPSVVVLLLAFPIFGGYLFNSLALFPIFILLTLNGLAARNVTFEQSQVSIVTS